MGLLDTLFGRTKPVAAKLDALFALPSAAVTLEASAGMTLSGRAGVCWKPPAGQAAEDVQREIGQLLAIDDSAETPDQAHKDPQGPAGGTPGVEVGTLTQAVDSYGYRWLLLEDPSVDDLVARVHLVNTMVAEGGWGPQLLCSVFSVNQGSGTKPVYLVYLYKRGTFYPFAPDGKEHRDNEAELRIRAILGSDLPVEADLSRWFPLWDLPVR